MRTVALSAAMAMLGVLCACSALRLGASQARPGWLEAPEAVREQGKFLTAQGQAQADTLEEADRLADEAARANLASVITEYVQTSTRAFLTASGAMDSPLAQQFVDTLATEVATAFLRSSISRDSWSEWRGRTHVLYRVPIALVNDKVVEKARQSLATANPFGEEPLNVVVRLEEFLQSRLEERLKVAARTRQPEPLTPPEGLTPAWLEAGRHADFPSAGFMSAIGLGPDARAAMDSARSELASQVESRLQGIVRQLRATPSTDPLAQNVQRLGPGSLHFTEADLVATRIPERWHDTVTDTYYALGVLDRTAATLAYRGRVEAALKQLEEKSASAETDRQAGSFAAALVDYLDALLAATNACRLQLSALAIAPDEARDELRNLIKEPIIGGAKDGLAAVLSGIELRKVSGDDQWVQPGGAPRAPLVVQVVAGAGRIPLAGMPVRMTVAEAAEPVLCETDEAGMARCAVSAPLPTGRPQGTVKATLDLERLAPEADLFGLEPPGVEFTYALRSRGSTLIAVYFYDAGTPSSAPAIAAQLKGALAAAGFRLVDDARVLQNVRAREPAADEPPENAIDTAGLRQSAAGPGESLIAVVGRLHTYLVESVEVSSGKVAIVYCDYAVSMVDTEAGGRPRTVMAAEGSGRGAYTDDPVQAAARAADDAAAAITEKVLGELSARFGAAPAAR